MKICFSPLQCNCVKIRKLNVLVRRFFFYPNQMRDNISWFFRSLCTPLVDIATFMCSVTLIGFSSVHVMLGIWSLVYSIFKKGHSATTKRVLILWSELIHLSTRLNTPIDKYGMTLRLKWSKNLFFLRYNWIFHKLI